MMFIEIYLAGLGVIFACLIVLWLISLVIKDASIIDIFWGSGFVISGWAYFLLTEGFEPRKLLIMTLVTIWGLRLSLYLAGRNLGKGEDFRYRRWREQHGGSWWWVSFFRVFALQGIIMWLVSVPVLGAQINPAPAELSILDYLAVIVWLIGFVFEAGGDWQLARFKANPANEGKVLNTGFWRYTRHPNYFGDAVQWWGFYLLALAGGSPLTIVSPIIMTFFLVRVSGVAMLERSLKKRKPEYQDYIERTSAFFPMPPKKKS